MAAAMLLESFAASRVENAETGERILVNTEGYEYPYYTSIYIYIYQMSPRKNRKAGYSPFAMTLRRKGTQGNCECAVRLF